MEVEKLRNFCMENMQIVSILYYILMFLISFASFIIVLIKLFPKLKCFCYTAKVNEQFGIDLVFINIRNKIIVLDKLIIYLKEQNNKSFFYKKNKKIINFKNLAIVSEANINCFLPFYEKFVYEDILKIKVKDLSGRKYNVKIKGAK